MRICRTVTIKIWDQFYKVSLNNVLELTEQQLLFISFYIYDLE